MPQLTEPEHQAALASVARLAESRCIAAVIDLDGTLVPSTTSAREVKLDRGSTSCCATWIGPACRRRSSPDGRAPRWSDCRSSHRIPGGWPSTDAGGLWAAHGADLRAPRRSWIPSPRHCRTSPRAAPARGLSPDRSRSAFTGETSPLANATAWSRRWKPSRTSGSRPSRTSSAYQAAWRSRCAGAASTLDSRWSGCAASYPMSASWPSETTSRTRTCSPRSCPVTWQCWPACRGPAPLGRRSAWTVRPPPGTCFAGWSRPGRRVAGFRFRTGCSSAGADWPARRAVRRGCWSSPTGLRHRREAIAAGRLAVWCRRSSRRSASAMASGWAGAGAS